MTRFVFGFIRRRHPSGCRRLRLCEVKQCDNRHSNDPASDDASDFSAGYRLIAGLMLQRRAMRLAVIAGHGVAHG